MASPKAASTNRAKKGLRKLPGWITASLGAERIGVSRQYMWDLINAGEIDAYEVEGTGTRAAFTIVRSATVDKLARDRAARQEKASAAEDSGVPAALGA